MPSRRSGRGGKSPVEAIYEACLLRFQADHDDDHGGLLGALPLALGMGVGSELRRPLGIAIVGGLIFSQMLTLYTTPVMYLYLDRFRLRMKAIWKERHPVMGSGQRRFSTVRGGESPLLGRDRPIRFCSLIPRQAAVREPAGGFRTKTVGEVPT